jgi:hypothetical protein
MRAAARLEFMRGYLLRGQLHIARSSARSQSCYEVGFADEVRAIAYTHGRPHRRDASQENYPGRIQHVRTGHPGASLLAILGLNVRYDLDIEPATRSVSSLPGNVCLTRSDGLLIGYKVACQFGSHPLR